MLQQVKKTIIIYVYNMPVIHSLKKKTKRPKRACLLQSYGYIKHKQEADIFKISANMPYICSQKFETS